jgi:hypothetical protein
MAYFLAGEGANEGAAMSSSMLIRLGGLMAIVGGVASTTLGLLLTLSPGYLPTSPSVERAIQKGSYEVTVLFLSLLGAIAAIAALHALQKGRYGLRGAVAALSSLAGLTTTAVGYLVGEISAVIATGTMFLIIAMLFVGLVVSTVGVVFLGATTISAKVLPRWCGVALIAGNPTFELLFYLFSPWLTGLPWVLVGYGVFRAAGRRSERPSRVR